MMATGEVRITAAKVGDWTKASRVLRGLATTVPEARRIIRATALDSRDRLKKNIQHQVYHWPPLAASTVRRKAAGGKDLRMLIEDGEYIEAIEVLPMGPNQWAVGVRKDAIDHEGNSLADIGLTHEYGYENIPPRPHWRREYAVFKRQLSTRLAALLGTKVSLR